MLRAGWSFVVVLCALDGSRGSAVNGLTAVASNDDVSSSNVTSRVSFRVSPGTTYRIAVAGYGGATGSVVLNWR